MDHPPRGELAPLAHQGIFVFGRALRRRDREHHQFDIVAGVPEKESERSAGFQTCEQFVFNRNQYLPTAIKGLDYDCDYGYKMRAFGNPRSGPLRLPVGIISR